MCKDCEYSRLDERMKRAIETGSMEDMVEIINMLVAAAEKHEISEWFGFSGYGGAGWAFPFFLDTKETLESILNAIRECRKHLYAARAAGEPDKYNFAIDSLTELEYTVSTSINECKHRISRYLF